MSEVALFDEDVLNDPAALAARDPGEMLRAVASAGAQVRAGARAAAEAGVGALRADGRPRAIVVAGMGGSGMAGDVLTAVCGTGCAVPIWVIRGYTLPGWASTMDLVIAVSCSGGTEETLQVADEARRRGCRLLTVGATPSPLADLADRAHGMHVRVDPGGRLPRANLWALTVPLLVAADAIGLASVPTAILDQSADALDALAERCSPSADTVDNPAKELALELAGRLPMIWGSSELAATAARRFACQLNENAKLPAVYGALPEVNHNQVVALDGPYGAGASAGSDDFFRDRVEADTERAGALRLVVMRDTEEHPQVTKRRAASVEIAESRGVEVTQVAAAGHHPVERLVSLIGLTDFVSVYLALGMGIDPTPIETIAELKERIRQ